MPSDFLVYALQTGARLIAASKEASRPSLAMSASSYPNDEFNLEFLQDPHYANQLDQFDSTAISDQMNATPMNSNQLSSTQFPPGQLSQQNPALSQLTASSQTNPQINQSIGFIAADYATPINSGSSSSSNSRNVYDSNPPASTYSVFDMTQMDTDQFTDFFDDNEENYLFNQQQQFGQANPNGNYSELDRLFDKNLS